MRGRTASMQEQVAMAEKIELGLPDSLELIRHDSYIEIVRKWFGAQFAFLTAFAIFWDGFLFFWYSKAFASGNLITLLFPLLHVAVGIGLTYYVVAGWFNRTHIYVSHGKMAVRHGPIPWFGNKELDTSSFKQLYTKEKISRNRNRTVTYETHVITRDSKDLKLVGGLDTSEQALYIEQAIETYLGIEDMPVKGGIN